MCVDATSLYLAQKRLDSLADAAALAGADGFTLVVRDDEPVAVLDEQALCTIRPRRSSRPSAGERCCVSAGTPDGVSARVTVADTWHPPLLTVFVPDGVALQATATSRTALR